MKHSEREVCERRRYPRRIWSAELVGLYEGTTETRAVERLAALDISTGGMAALSDSDHPVGRCFLLGLPKIGGGVRYIFARVVRCQPIDDIGLREVGLAFDGVAMHEWAYLDCPNHAVA